MRSSSAIAQQILRIIDNRGYAPLLSLLLGQVRELLSNELQILVRIYNSHCFPSVCAYFIGASHVVWIYLRRRFPVVNLGQSEQRIFLFCELLLVIKNMISHQVQVGTVRPRRIRAAFGKQFISSSVVVFMFFSAHNDITGDCDSSCSYDCASRSSCLS